MRGLRLNTNLFHHSAHIAGSVCHRNHSTMVSAVDEAFGDVDRQLLVLGSAWVVQQCVQTSSRRHGFPSTFRMQERANYHIGRDRRAECDTGKSCHQFGPVHPPIIQRLCEHAQADAHDNVGRRRRDNRLMSCRCFEWPLRGPIRFHGDKPQAESCERIDCVRQESEESPPSSCAGRYDEAPWRHNRVGDVISCPHITRFDHFQPTGPRWSRKLRGCRDHRTPPTCCRIRAESVDKAGLATATHSRDDRTMLEVERIQKLHRRILGQDTGSSR